MGYEVIKAKRIRILRPPEKFFANKGFDIKIGDEFNVIEEFEAKGEHSTRRAFLINCNKNKKSLVVYINEVEILK